MRVFLSWSGEQSRLTAEILARFIRTLVQAVDPWISVDLDKGTRWSAQIADALETSRLGVFCLTRDNLEAPWLLFEAGAVAKTRDASVLTFLLNVDKADVTGPLGQFQHTEFTKDDVLRLLRTVRARAGEDGVVVLPETDFLRLYEILWPGLEQELTAVREQPQSVLKATRPDRAILEEILSMLRSFQRLIGQIARPPVPHIPRITSEPTIADLSGEPRPVDLDEIADALARMTRSRQGIKLDHVQNEGGTDADES